MKTKIIIAFLTLRFASTGYPVPINILGTQYTTTIADTTLNSNTNPVSSTPFSRTQSSTVPFSDSLYDSYGFLKANANAGLFGASTHTDSGPIDSYGGGFVDSLVISSSAFVESDLWFSPLTSQTTTINIQIGEYLAASPFVSADVSLLDVTSGNEVWSYGNGIFNYVGAPPGITYAITLNPVDFSAGPFTLMLDTDLNASDTYELSMLTGCAAGGDEQSTSIQLLSGLETVPEPSTFALIGLGSLAIVMVQATRRKC